MKKLLPILLALLLCGCVQQTADVEYTLPVTVPETTVETASLPTEVPTEPPEPSELVRVSDYIPGISVELRYATENNFTGRTIYDFREAWLRYGTVEKLLGVQKELEALGLSLKIWDAFRPVMAQYRLWEICPDPTYVSNPEKGYSTHSRGNTLDVTVVDMDGNELEMPTPFDEFSPKADRNYADCGETAAENAKMLQDLMESHGFKGYFGEWWHFSDTERLPGGGMVPAAQREVIRFFLESIYKICFISE